MLLVVAIAVSVFFITFASLVARRRRIQRAERAGHIRRAYYTDDLATVDRALDSPAAGLIVDLMRERDVRDRAKATTEAILRRNLELNMGLVDRAERPAPEPENELVREAVERSAERLGVAFVEAVVEIGTAKLEAAPEITPYHQPDPHFSTPAEPSCSSDAGGSYDGGTSNGSGGSSGEW